jgi:hypothetical protein
VGRLAGAEIKAHYFADLCRRYGQLQRKITWGILLLSSGAVGAILSGLPDAIRLSLALATAGLSLWSLIENYGKTAIECSDVHFRWSKLSLDYKALWNDMYSNDARKRLGDIQNREAELAKTCNPLPNRAEDLRKWQRYVVDQHGLSATTVTG